MRNHTPHIISQNPSLFLSKKFEKEIHTFLLVTIQPDIDEHYLTIIHNLFIVDNLLYILVGIFSPSHISICS